MNRFRLLLLVILLLGFLFRFYRFDNPIADWHSWRQAETSMVARNFVTNGFDLLHPRMDNLSNVQSGKDNPEGYFFVEFPLYNAAQAGLFTLFGVFTIEQWGRLVSIISSTLAALFLYLIVSRHSNRTIGLLSAAFYAFIPYNIYFGRTILTDTSMVMAILGGIYFFDLWIEEKSKVKSQKSKVQFKIKNFSFYILALLFTGSALLLKAHAVFFVLPIVYLAFRHFGWKTFFQWQLWVFAIFAVAPLAWWRTWMMQYPEGIPANAWLFNGNGIRFRPSFFRWMFYERLTKLMLGYTGIALLAYGVFMLRKLKDWGFFVAFIASSLLYVFVFATGNVQHDYYQIPVMPTLAMLCAIGTYALSRKVIKLKVIKSQIPVGAIVAIILVATGGYFSWMQVRDFFNINNRAMLVAGEAIDRLLPKDAKIIANYNGDSSFLYQTKRKGWASIQDAIPVMVDKGASYLVLLNPTPADYAFEKEGYTIIAETKEYLIYDLRSPVMQ